MTPVEMSEQALAVMLAALKQIHKTTTRRQSLTGGGKQIVIEPVGDRVILTQGNLRVSIGTKNPIKEYDEDIVEWGFVTEVDHD